jgi:catechol 2,3-dioxygenase
VTASPERLKPLADHKPARPIADGVRIGHVHLKVADLDRALSFYCGVLGFDLMERRGNEAAFLSAGGCRQLAQRRVGSRS